MKAGALPALANEKGAGGVLTLSPRRWDLLAVGVLLVATLPWWSAVWAQFIYYDDSVYITENPDVLAGLTPGSVKAAFTSTRGAMWIPMTWLSFMLDVSLFGRGPMGFHFTNVVLHLANALLLYAFLRQATGKPVRSLLVALFWVMHPLRVESVAWATERKDVLSMFFGLLALIAYVRYVRAAGKGIGWYVGVCVMLLCGLMAKPMLVTLPCVLLLLDVWPLGRWKGGMTGVWRLVGEKIPLFLIVAGISAATLMIPAEQRVIVTTLQRSISARAASALSAYVYYLRDTVWLEQLSIFYPMRLVSVGEALLAAILLLAITGAVVWAYRRFPENGKPALVGWLWFVGALVPTSGLFQMGSQSRADRFTYYPAIGLIMVVVWALPAQLFEVRVGRLAAGLLSAGVTAVLAVVTFSQIGLWHDPFKLYYYSAVRTSPNYLMEFMVGKQAEDANNAQDAVEWYMKSIQSWPGYSLSHHNLATIYAKSGYLHEAVAEFRVAVQLDPGNAEMRRNLEWAERELAKQAPPQRQ